MALEKSLWKRCKGAEERLKLHGHLIHLCRIENTAGAGNPDIEGCIDRALLAIELKSCMRPARATTPVRPKKRESQTIWHGERTAAGCRTHWILIQVGENRKAKLYLIPGCYADKIVAPESELDLLSVVNPKQPIDDILLRARLPW